jgi:ribose transport system substrate-binding protein
MMSHIAGGSVEKEISVPILTVTSENIDKELPVVKQTVFANEVK